MASRESLVKNLSGTFEKLNGKCGYRISGKRFRLPFHLCPFGLYLRLIHSTDVEVDVIVTLGSLLLTLETSGEMCC